MRLDRRSARRVLDEYEGRATMLTPANAPAKRDKR